MWGRRWWWLLALGLHGAMLHAQVADLQHVIAVTAGGTAPYAHSCAVDESGAAYCWGSNQAGQLGDGSQQPRRLATRVLGQPEAFRQLSAGTSSTCALGISGRVYCWGSGSGLTPAEIPLAGVAKAISSQGSVHGCALLTSGDISCWGSNFSGQLGGGDEQTQRVDRVALPAAATTVATGVTHTCAALVDGRVYCWGNNRIGQIGPAAPADPVFNPVEVTGLPAAAVALGLGDFSSCAVLASGALHCWGDFGGGSTPSVVGGLTSGVTGVSVGGYGHLCASFAAGGLQCFGLNFEGQLGRGEISLQEDIGAVVGLSGPITSFDAGYFHLCAVIAGGVKCWGENAYGQLGTDDDALATVPAPVQGIESPLRLIEGGSDHSCAVDDRGRAYCWGSNISGQLGDGSLRSRAVAAPIAGADAVNVKALALGDKHSCALDSTGQVRCWGANYFGQLGTGDFSSTQQPVLISTLSGVTSLSASLSNTCAVVAGGVARCWGYNRDGELGDGSTEDRNAPVAVQGLPAPVTAIASAYGHTCALTTQGAVWCWGGNYFGNLGRTTTSNSAVPPGQVDGLSAGVEQIAVGYGLSCALISAERAVRCWGIGYGPVPQPVAGLDANVIKIAADGGNRISGAQQQVCAVFNDGSLRCAGSNKFGQLGDGSTVERPHAAPVSGARAAVAIGVGEHHACYIDDAGVGRCWGNNAIGQLGLGMFGVSPSPASVVTDQSLAQIESASESGNGASGTPRSDANGRYLVFESLASNLVSGDINNARDVFRQDRSSGRIELVSVDDDGRAFTGNSIEPSVSADGALIVFVAPDTAVGKLAGENTRQAAARRKTDSFGVYLRNMQTGSTQRIATGLPGGIGTAPNIAPFAGAIVYTGLPASPSEGTPGQSNLFVVPLARVGQEYVPSTPSCPTCKTLSKMSDGPSRDGVLSANADWLAFVTQASNLPGTSSPCAAGSAQVMLRNMQTGQTSAISAPATATQCSGLGSGKPSIDWSGSRVVFETANALATSDENGYRDIYLYDAEQGTQRRVSEDPSSGDDGLEESGTPSISGDGNVVTFQSLAKNLESSEPDDNEANDIFVRNLATGAMQRVSRSQRGDQGDASSAAPALNWNGASVLFASQAGNLLLNQATGQSRDSNRAQDVFRTDNPLVAASKSGTWWIPSESGWGLFTVDQGSALGVGWFTYDTDGEPTWFVGSAEKQSDGRYVGAMYRQTGKPLADIDGVATETNVKFADITLSFSGSAALGFEYAVVGGVSQRKWMSRFVFNGDDIVCRPSAFASRELTANMTDLWWGGADTSGWGIFVNQARDLLVSTWYTFDVDHEALFLTALATRQPDGRFTGPLYRQVNGTPLQQINGAPPSLGAEVIGSVSVSALDGETADFSYSIGSTSQTRRISRYTFGDTPQSCTEARP